MLALSLVLVLGTTAIVAMNMVPSTSLHFGYAQMIHARIPWLLLGALWVGLLCAAVAVRQKPSWWRIGIGATELALVGLWSVLFLSASFVQRGELAVRPGDRFPSFQLPDQDRRLVSFPPVGQSNPALFIFYRGDW